MAVYIDRDLNRRVTHLLLDIHERLALLNEERGKRVPEIMNPTMPEVGFFEELRGSRFLSSKSERVLRHNRASRPRRQCREEEALFCRANHRDLKAG
jgi:hypothetical protein